MSKIKDSTILITGGASGIGEIMGNIVAQKGAKLVIWDINRTALDTVIAKLRSRFDNIYGYQVDTSDPQNVHETALLVRKEVGNIDTLINNAGIIVGKYFHEHTITDINRTIDINTKAQMYVTREFINDMIKRKSGHICNIASSAGLISNPKMSVYCASKWASCGWSDSLRIEMDLLKSGIHVTTVTPYYISTGMFAGVQSIIPLLKPENVAQKIIRGIEHDKIYVSMPWSMRLVRLSQGILPIRLFDWLIGKKLGIYKSMDHFKGREKK